MTAQTKLDAECAELDRLTQRLAADFERILAGKPAPSCPTETDVGMAQKSYERADAAWRKERGDRDRRGTRRVPENVLFAKSEIFESRYIPEPMSGCWLWTAATSTAGYGLMCLGGRAAVLAHRFSWNLHKGPIPDGLWVCHKCDTPLCVNPDHLFLGTDADNIADKVRKGRHPRIGPRGDLSGHAKLTRDDVDSIRADHRSCYVLGQLYGVDPTTINKLRLRKTWRHLPVTEGEVGRIQKLYEIADSEWRAELVRTFGGGAYAAMYRGIGQGEPGSLLRELFDAREAAAEHYRKVEMDYCRGDAR